MSCHISIQRIKFELHAGALPICYPRPYKYVLFYRNSRNIAFRAVNVLTFHNSSIGTHVLIQIVSETEPGMAVLLHVTPAMPRKRRGDWA